jgi:hypothetical protein
MNIQLSNGKVIPMEMHKVRIVQKINLVPAARRLQAIEEAGYNTFLLRTKDILLDMLTDSGTNAMSDNQLAAMMVADDAYAGSESFYKLADAVQEILGFTYTIPASGPGGRTSTGQGVCQTRRRGLDELSLYDHQSPLRTGGGNGLGDLHGRGIEHAKRRSLPRKPGPAQT